MALPGKNKISIKEVYNYLMTKPKMTKNKALGIIANIQAESMFYSDAVEMDKTVENKGIGLFQHTFPSRKKAFQEQVPDWKTNWKGQIDFALEEKEAQNYLNSNYKDKENATEAFMKEFENPQDQSSEAIQGRIDSLNVISFDDNENIIVTEQSKTDEEIAQQKEIEGYYPVTGEEPIDESTLLPEIEITDDSKETSKTKYRKEVINRLSGRKEYLKYLEENQDLFKELKSLEEHIPLLSPGTKQHTDATKRYNELTRNLTKKELKLKEHLYKKELNNYVNAENNAREEQTRLENELKTYLDAKEEPPQDLINKINKAKNDKNLNGNRVKELNATNWQDYSISPVQQGYNQNILLPDGTIDVQASKQTPVLEDPLDDKDVVYNVVDENTNTNIIPEGEVVTIEEPPVIEEAPIAEGDPEVPEGDPKLTNLQKIEQAGTSLLKGAGAVLDYIGGPGAIVSYIMGKKGLKEAMKEVKPQASAELSPMFMQHLRQSRELAKKGFHPDEARKVRKGIDAAYQKGLDDAVRGTAGDRAKYLAQSGILDAKRSSALLDLAAKDAQMQRVNADKYEKVMMFKENFDITQTEKERTEDMERQLAAKKAATEFTSAAFSNVISGLGGSGSTSAIMEKMMNTYGGRGLFNTIDKK